MYYAPIYFVCIYTYIYTCMYVYACIYKCVSIHILAVKQLHALYAIDLSKSF